MKKKVCFVICFLLIMLLWPFSSPISAFAHENMLDAQYDDCVPVTYVDQENIGDGIDEKWYELYDLFHRTFHIPHSTNSTTEIKYYFSPVGKDSQDVTWYSDLSNERANRLINGYKASMEKWNNVWFYSFNDSGIVEKKKLVNIVEGDSTDFNLIIYPAKNIDSYAVTSPSNSNGLVETNGTYYHYHFNQWYMEINLNSLRRFTEEAFNAFLNRTGAHEIGHILGLKDIDKIETMHQYHHEEILMGYSLNGILKRQSEITYKDIAGASINRGFHTDNDHKWMTDEIVSENGFKLICSICNGVKYVNSLENYDYVILNSCGGNHSLSSNNLMAVACYNNLDYYKCKYCRYVAQFTLNAQQNYSYSFFNSNMHRVLNNTTGLKYYFYKQHTEPNNCEKCNNVHTHFYTYTANGSNHLVECVDCSYSSTSSHVYNNHYCIYCNDYTTMHNYRSNYIWYNYTSHYATCICGATSTMPHVVRSGSYVCLSCGGPVERGFIEFDSQSSCVIYVTHNGSFILPNGIIVLVEGDVDSYFNGTLVFYNKNDNLEII